MRTGSCHSSCDSQQEYRAVGTICPLDSSLRVTEGHTESQLLSAILSDLQKKEPTTPQCTELYRHIKHTKYS